MTNTRLRPIGQNDTVSVQGRYLVYDNDPDRRFLMRGIAFPTTTRSDAEYNLDGWMAVLDQLSDLTDINTIRVYRMNCTHQNDYSTFINHAAELGIYVIVPLTAPTGGGVLDRKKKAPACYPRRLYEYGKACVNKFLKFPNVVAGVIGNEVMNSLETWFSAPCIKAYARDLKLYMVNYKEKHDVSRRSALPLLYAAQHDSMTAAILTQEAMQMTLGYLACVDDADNFSGIDIFGINVESWCSSLQTFHYNEDGITETSYYSLWQTFQNVSIPLIFSEMGCSKNLFNRDNGLQRYVRDWAQVPVVLNEMSDVFSGFCAYTYFGNPVFGMMDPDQAWDGVHVLQASPDFDNFRQQLSDAEKFSPKTFSSTQSRPSCPSALEMLQDACVDCNFNSLIPMDKMPSYAGGSHYRQVVATFMVIGLVLAAMAFRSTNRLKVDDRKEVKNFQTRYQSIK
jgi:hypothetical protein